MPEIPCLDTIDSTFRFMKNPYRFISQNAKRLKTDVFETRLFLGKTICMTGQDAAQIFTDEALFSRNKAAPEPIAASLLGKGGVQGLDGEAHRHRKKLFMSFMTMANVQELQSSLKHWLDFYSIKWMHQTQVKLYEEFQEILTRTVCSWAGIEFPESEIYQKTKDLTSMFDSAGSIRKNIFARFARNRSQKWIEHLVIEIRQHKHKHLEGTPIYVVAQFQDENGIYLKPEIAAVEVLNILRPTVAVSLYFVFCVHALHLHPESKQRLLIQEAGYMDFFINEVRRFYPFFPALNSIVKQDFKWGRIHFKKGTRVMLDLYGINHDVRVWEKPNEFLPDRFKKTRLTPFNFIPQGTGDHDVDHRCPGELFTIELMRTLVEYFVLHISYEIPDQNLQVQMDRLPALPVSHMKISNLVKRVPFFETHI